MHSRAQVYADVIENAIISASHFVGQLGTLYRDLILWGKVFPCISSANFVIS